MTDEFPREPRRLPDIDIFFDPFAPPPVPRPSPRRIPGKDPGDPRRRAPAPAPVPIPIPEPVPRAPTPVPFPGGPAANDPVFSIGKTILGRGIAAVNVAIILRDILERAARNAELEDERRRKAEERIESRRRGASKPMREVVFPSDFPAPPVPDSLPAPEKFPLPRPEIFPLPPEIPAPISVPRPVPLPGPLAVPGDLPIPAPTPLPRRAAPGRPAPATTPVPRPVTVPRPFVLPFYLPFAQPSPLPRAAPIGDPLPRSVPGDLTRFQPGGVRSPLGFLQTAPAPQPSAQASTQKCEAVKRRRRKKGKCREGFFIEDAGQTRYITWRTKDCATGRTIKERRRKSGNVLTFPGG